MCIDIMLIWFEITNGLSSFFDKVICPPNSSGGVLLFTFLLVYVFIILKVHSFQNLLIFTTTAVVCLFVCVEVLPVNPMGSCRARSVYLTKHLLAEPPKPVQLVLMPCDGHKASPNSSYFLFVNITFKIKKNIYIYCFIQKGTFSILKTHISLHIYQV